MHFSIHKNVYLILKHKKTSQIQKSHLIEKIQNNEKSQIVIPINKTQTMNFHHRIISVQIQRIGAKNVKPYKNPNTYMAFRS